MTTLKTTMCACGGRKSPDAKSCSPCRKSERGTQPKPPNISAIQAAYQKRKGERE